MYNVQCTKVNNISSSTPRNICERTFIFSTNLIKLIEIIPKTTAGIAISKQVVRSGTSIGANTEEAQNSGTKKEFIHTMTIALKEARETEYWLKLLAASFPPFKIMTQELINEVNQLIRILTTIIKNSKS